jgi:hypothetical protein
MSKKEEGDKEYKEGYETARDGDPLSRFLNGLFGFTSTDTVFGKGYKQGAADRLKFGARNWWENKTETKPPRSKDSSKKEHKSTSGSSIGGLAGGAAGGAVGGAGEGLIGGLVGLMPIILYGVYSLIVISVALDNNKIDSAGEFLFVATTLPFFFIVGVAAIAVGVVLFVLILLFNIIFL